MQNQTAQNRWWHPENYSKKIRNLKIRNKVIDLIRAYFNDDDFFEVDTPALQISPGLETHLKAFATKLEQPLSGEMKQFYLHTSPEFAMKKLLTARLPKIFQFAKCFRNGEKSFHHHPEFCMLEWYRAGHDYKILMDDCDEILKQAVKLTKNGYFDFNGIKCFADEGAERYTVQEIFLKHTGIDILEMLPKEPTLEPDATKFKQEAMRIGIKCSDDDRWDDVFFRIALAKVEPELGKGKPTIIYDYPVCMAALSRPKPEDNRLAERFELYVSGLELANAFSELTDAQTQRKRFEHDMELKQKLYGYTYPIDEDFINALEFGMPECTGIALGVDRLAMLAANVENIEDVLWAPVDS